MRKLYKVSIEVEMIVLAEDAHDAEDVAEENVREVDLRYEGSFVAGRPIEKLSQMKYDEDYLDSLPYSDNSDEDDFDGKTCRQILDMQNSEEILEEKKQAAMAKNTLTLPGL